jgi:fermentation-respiration switch protein FrsA (DUF1100 family)
MDTSVVTESKRFSGRWVTAALVTWGVLLALLVGADGSPGWRLARIGIVCSVTAASLWLWARTRQVGAGVILGCGTVALALGLVFGLRFLADGALNWRALVGLVMLVDGLVLVAAGMRRLVSGLGRVWRFAAGAALVFVVLLAVWTLTPGIMATNIPPIAVAETTPADYGMVAREVRFAAADGVDLWAWYVPPQNGAAVVLRHGSGSTASSALAHAAVLARHGYGVLVTDARGHARSDGRAMDFGWYGDSDIAAAVSFLSAQPNVDPARIGVLGLSMGGEEALGAAGSDARIAAVVAEGATGRTNADKAWFADLYGVRGQIQLGLEWLQYSLTDLLTDASKPMPLAEAARSAAPRPVLLIAAGQIPDEGNAAAFIQQHAPASVTIWEVPDAGHIQGLSVAPVEWERTVIGFLDAAVGEP